ncbi:MAG: imidazole glycerol phosphate synthase subunit HisF, partial [Thermodesulfobacteria bacterium]|nr:imidazole glycerol phosphate synthase subunit HisF [Thermodesulfobacteriota bacterium]
LPAVKPPRSPEKTRLAKRIVACLDVRTNDEGDLVVTKGDQYDVREAGRVRNLGKPVELARRYYTEGADEITFLNITGFRDFPLKDLPMLEVLRLTSQNVFVPLTIGGGIRDFMDRDGRFYSALEVAAEYFRSGADKVSIGSDAVLIVEEYLRTGKATGKSSIETISRVYGAQAVVISIDPRRVYVDSPAKTRHPVIETEIPGPNGERYCWFQCTIKGGREGRDLDAITLARVCEKLGAGEILLNSIDRDGTNQGFDIELIQAVKEAVSIPVIASSGAGCPEHFYEVFVKTDVEAALAAGIFHRREVSIEEVKKYLQERGVEIRPVFKEELL